MSLALCSDRVAFVDVDVRLDTVHVLLDTRRACVLFLLSCGRFVILLSEIYRHTQNRYMLARSGGSPSGNHVSWVGQTELREGRDGIPAVSI